MKTPWITLKDAYDGIESFLLDGPKSMREICNHAAKHGVGDAQTVGMVGHLVTADRMVTVIRPFSPGHLSGQYRLTEWNADLLKKEAV